MSLSVKNVHKFMNGLPLPSLLQSLSANLPNLIIRVFSSATLSLNLPRKQRHTAKAIFNRLADEHGFTGGYRTVCTYVEKRKKAMKLEEAKTYEKLEHPAGEAQVDFYTMKVSKESELDERSSLDMERPHYQKGKTIKELWEEEKKSLKKLPSTPYEVFRLDSMLVNNYGEVKVHKMPITVFGAKPGTYIMHFLLAKHSHSLNVLRIYVKLNCCYSLHKIKKP